MAGLSATDIALLVVAGFVAVTVLVRLMINRRDDLLDDLSSSAKRTKKKPAAPKKAA